VTCGGAEQTGNRSAREFVTVKDRFEHVCQVVD
jgi:hypothetical protein